MSWFNKKIETMKKLMMSLMAVALLSTVASAKTTEKAPKENVNVKTTTYRLLYILRITKKSLYFGVIFKSARGEIYAARLFRFFELIGISKAIRIAWFKEPHIYGEIVVRQKMEFNFFCFCFQAF